MSAATMSPIEACELSSIAAARSRSRCSGETSTLICTLLVVELETVAVGSGAFAERRRLGESGLSVGRLVVVPFCRLGRAVTSLLYACVPRNTRKSLAGVRLSHFVLPPSGGGKRWVSATRD